MFLVLSKMHSILSILLNTILLFNSQPRNLITKNQHEDEIVDPKLSPLTVNLLTDTNTNEFVPMEVISSQEIVSLCYFISGVFQIDLFLQKCLRISE